MQQQVLAQAKIEQLTKQGVWSQQIVTEVKAADIFIAQKIITKIMLAIIRKIRIAKC